MRMSWWMAPVAVLLVLVGAGAGVLLARQPAQAPRSEAKVHAPRAVTTPKSTVDPAPAKPPEQAAPPVAAEEPKPAPPEPQRPTDSEATAFVQSFLRARMDGDAKAVAAMLAPSLANKEAIRVAKPDARITAYAAELLGSGDMDSFIFRLLVAFDHKQPGSEVAAENVRLSWKDGFKVAAFEDVARDALAVGVGKDGLLAVNRGQDTWPAGDLALLPAMAHPAGSTAEFGVGKEGWSVAAVSLTGNHVLWVTKGLHPLLGVTAIKKDGPPDVRPLDLLFEAGGVDAAWAPGAEEKFVAISVAQPSGATTLVVWDVAAGKKSGPDLQAQFGAPDYAVRNIRWLSGSVVAFDVLRNGAVSVGWRYDAVSGSLKAP